MVKREEELDVFRIFLFVLGFIAIGYGAYHVRTKPLQPLSVWTIVLGLFLISVGWAIKISTSS